MLLLVIAAVLITSCAPAAEQKPAAKALPDEIMVGVVQPLTGTFVVFGI